MMIHELEQVEARREWLCAIVRKSHLCQTGMDGMAKRMIYISMLGGGSVENILDGCDVGTWHKVGHWPQPINPMRIGARVGGRRGVITAFGEANTAHSFVVCD